MLIFAASPSYLSQTDSNYVTFRFGRSLHEVYVPVWLDLASGKKTLLEEVEGSVRRGASGTHNRQGRGNRLQKVTYAQHLHQGPHRQLQHI